METEPATKVSSSFKKIRWRTKFKKKNRLC